MSGLHRNRGASRRPKQIRALNQPKRIRVWTRDDGTPEAIEWKSKRSPVGVTKDRWRIDDEWWRQPIARRYVRVVLDTGVLVTLYHDLLEDLWYVQDA